MNKAIQQIRKYCCFSSLMLFACFMISLFSNVIYVGYFYGDASINFFFVGLFILFLSFFVVYRFFTLSLVLAVQHIPSSYTDEEKVEQLSSIIASIPRRSYKSIFVNINPALHDQLQKEIRLKTRAIKSTKASKLKKILSVFISIFQMLLLISWIDPIQFSFLGWIVDPISTTFQSFSEIQHWVFTVTFFTLLSVYGVVDISIVPYKSLIRRIKVWI